MKLRPVVAAAAAFAVGLAGMAAAQPAAASPTNPAWALQKTPNPTVASGGYEAASASCPSSTFCAVVGEYGTGQADPLAENWNGTKWTSHLITPPRNSLGAGLNAVSCASASMCTAVGTWSDAYYNTHDLAEAWNGTSWVSRKIPTPQGADPPTLAGISCPTQTSCLAVGDYEDALGDHPLAYRWNGTAWSAVNPPSPDGAFAAVSCTTADACVAVGTDATDGNALAETFDGTSWTVQNVPSPAGAQDATLSGVSCGSAGSCVAVGSITDSTGTRHTLSETWNGAAWTPGQTVDPTGTTFPSLSAVSCTSPTGCTAVGETTDSTGTQQPLIEAWNGTAWSTRTAQAPAGATASQLNTVTCTSSTTCRAFGQVTTPTSDGGYEIGILSETSAGGSWSLAPLPALKTPEGNEVEAVSCPSATKCISVGAADDAKLRSRIWNGTAWTIHAMSGSGSLVGISCPATTMCVAVGYQISSSVNGPLAETWNGSTWTPSTPPEPTGSSAATLFGVSCVSATWCMAVGDYVDGSNVYHPLAELWNGSTWTVKASADANVNENDILASVSCTATTSCVTVAAGFAEVWKGTRWTYSAIPAASGTANYVNAVSCVSATWCVAVGADSPAAGGTDTLIDVWNGTSWAAANQGSTTSDGHLFAVSCTATTFCQAVGLIGYGSTFADGWNGTTWTPTNPPNPAGTDITGTQLNSVSCSDADACTAVGWANVGGTDVSLAERYS